MTDQLVIRWRGDKPVKAYYEAGRRDPQRKQRKETRTADGAIIRAGTSIREQARHLDQNHDLAVGALNVLVQNVVGPTGIGIDPVPRTVEGDIHDEFAEQILRLHQDWIMRPEVTWQHDWVAVQRLACRTWFRDGEALAQHVAGNIASLDHGTQVPYSIELIEPDLLPLDHNKPGTPRIVAGIEVNGWNRPIAYHIYKEHPGDMIWGSSAFDTKRVTADRIAHLKLVSRIGQLRGVSVLAPVMLRLDDIKDYEESERIAAKVAASMAAYIKKGNPDHYDVATDADGNPIEGEARNLRFRAGMVFDDLLPGEEIGTIDTKRPSSALEPFRNGQLRAAASGLRVTYSSLSNDYSGSYSSQRQELVEGYGAYGILASEFMSMFVRPTYLRFLETAITAGQLVIPQNIDPLTIGDALYLPPQMPWIDPIKEAKAWEILDENDYASGQEIVRRRGQNPRDVLDQSKRWKEMREKRGLISDEQEQLPIFEDDKDGQEKALQTESILVPN
ncbi:MAG: phage portal protein [Candidatus Thiodiazotropha taylori]